MHWILIVYFTSYAGSVMPHFMGDFATREACESLLSQMRQYEAGEVRLKGFAYHYAGYEAKCFYVENGHGD